MKEVVEGKSEAWRIALLEDHPLIREAYRAAIDAEPDMRVSGSFATSGELMDLLRLCLVDVILMDYRLTDEDADGVSLIQRLRARFPATRLLVCSASSDEATVSACLIAGAHGFVSKRTPLADCVTGLRMVAGGAHHLSLTRPATVPADRPDPFARWRNDRTLDAASSGISLPQGLTIKEFDVIRCVRQGLSATKTAEKLRRSVKTVSGHRVAAFEKMGVTGDAELCRQQPRARDGQEIEKGPPISMAR